MSVSTSRSRAPARVQRTSSSVNASFIDYRAAFINEAIECDPNGVSEGLRIVTPNWIYVGTGLHAQLNGVSAGGQLVGGHVEALSFGARLDRRPQFAIEGTEFQKAQVAGAFTAIELVRCDNARVTGTWAHRPGASSPDEYGLVVAASTRVVATGNDWDETLDMGAIFQGDTSGCVVVGNKGLVANLAGAANLVEHNG